MEQDRKGKIYRKLFVGFFAVMLVCTVISRIYDSVTVPKVVTERMKQKPVDTVVYGSGTIREKETVSLDIYPGIKVESVPVIPGTVVKSGDVIASYQLESLLEAKADCAGELEKLNLRQTGNVPSQQDDITEKWRFGGYFEVRWNAIDNTFERNN